jgi:hypothetical protein
MNDEQLTDQARAYWGGVLACRILRSYITKDVAITRAIYQDAVADDGAESLVTGLMNVAANLAVERDALRETVANHYPDELPPDDLHASLDNLEEQYRAGTALATGLANLPTYKEN